MLLSNLLLVLFFMTAIPASPWPQPAPVNDIIIHIHVGKDGNNSSSLPGNNIHIFAVSHLRRILL